MLGNFVKINGNAEFSVSFNDYFCEDTVEIFYLHK